MTSSSGDIDLTFRKNNLVSCFEAPLQALGIGLTDILANDTILDIGCGAGELVEELSKHNTHVIGVDNGLIRIKKPKIFRADTKRLPFANEYFDTVISSNLYGIMSDEMYVMTQGWEIMPEVHRVLRTGGIYLLTDLAPLDFLPTQGFAILYPNPGNNNRHLRILKKKPQ